MNINFKIVDSSLTDDLLKIEGFIDQTFYIGTIKSCLEESYQNKMLIPLGIFDGDTLVGFAMYGFRKRILFKDQMWIDYFVIDKHFYKENYACEVFKKLVELIRNRTKGKIYLSVSPKNLKDIEMYNKTGFKFTGKYNKHFEKIMILEN